MSKHTKGPWRLKPIGPRDVAGIVDDRGRAIASWTFRGRRSDEAQRADAARAVACVNACDGIEDPSVVPELLAALKTLRLTAPFLTSLADGEYKERFAAALMAAYDAIARAEGRK